MLSWRESCGLRSIGTSLLILAQSEAARCLGSCTVGGVAPTVPPPSWGTFDVAAWGSTPVGDVRRPTGHIAQGS